MKNKTKLYSFKLFLVLVPIVLFTIVSCGNNEGQDPSKFSNTKKVDGANDISAFELENGFGPVKQKIELRPIDPKLVKQGQTIFETKCAACHKLDEKYVGPAQRDVIKRRTPEYILNFMLNPEENYQKHPEAKKMLAQYLTQMPNQNISIDEAKAVLDYFRKVAEEK